MGIGNFDSGSDEEQNQNDPSGTHIYFYQRGHDRLPGDEGDDAYETIADAYEQARTKPTEGPVRSYASSQYSSGMAQMLGEFVNTMGDCLEAESPLPLIELAVGDLPSGAQAKVLAQFLDRNEETKQELTQRMKSDQAATADD